MKWVIVVKYHYGQEYVESGCAADNLAVARDIARTLADGWPWRQYAIVRNHTPQGWSGKNPRYVYGASDADLYRATYGEEMPIGSAAGELIDSVPSTEM